MGCTFQGFVEALKEPLSLDDFMGVIDTSGKSVEDLRAEGFTVIESKGRIIRSFTVEEEKKLGIRHMSDELDQVDKGPIEMRPYGSQPHCPIRIIYG